MKDYDVIEMSQESELWKGRLYLSDTRSASYQYNPGATHIHLEQDGGPVYQGICNQIDKAELICSLWVGEERLVELGGFHAEVVR